METSEREVGEEHRFTTPPRRSPQITRPWDRAEYQRLWMRVASRDWQTLAVVPVEDGVSTVDVANLIVALGASHGESIGVFDFRDVQMGRALEVIKAAERQLERGERLVFATRSIRANIATIPLARATDGAVLCVSIGSTRMSLAAETIEQIGREHFIGSILVRSPGDEASAHPADNRLRSLAVRC
jgi:hypothetical protein